MCELFYLINNQMANLKEIINEIKKEKLLLPSFQREFIWSEEAQKNLLSSVITQVPCTSSLFVEESNYFKSTFYCRAIGKKVNNGYVDTKGKTFTYVLDGQQRFTSLYFSLTDVYEDKTTREEKDEFYKTIYDKLKNRFFLKLYDSERDKYLFGFENLTCDKVIFEEYMPDDVIDFIYHFQNIDETKEFYNINSNNTEIIDGCVKESMIPFFWFFSDKNKVQIRRIFEKIGFKRCEKIIEDNLFYKLKESYLSNNIDISEFDEMVSKIMGSSQEREEANKYFDKNNSTTSQNWALDIEDYIYNQISTYEIIPIKLNNINKAFATFSHINNSGTKLSTLDLVCARMEKKDLRLELINGISNQLAFFDKDFIINSISLDDESFGLMYKGSLDKSFSDFFIQVLNILHFKNSINPKTGKLNEIEDLPSNFSKQDYSLKNLNEEFLNDYLEKGIEVAIKTCIFLNYHCGHRSFKDVTNKLILLPLSLALIYKDSDLSVSNVKNMISFFWINLFSGRYDSHQNINCHNDCKDIYKLIVSNDILIQTELKSKLLNNVLNVEGFATKSSLTNPINAIPKESAVKNIFMFIRSKYNPLPDWIPGKNISQNEKIEIHHIIPLAKASTINQSSKEIRQNKGHLLNSTMNKTPISFEANRKIKTFTLTDYGNTLSKLTLDKHIITTNWINITYDSTRTNEIINLFEDRYDDLTRELRMVLDPYLNF